MKGSSKGADDQEGDQRRLCLSALVGQDPQVRIEFTIGTANRKCGTQAQVEEALRFAFEHIKETDVVCLGMWQKTMDQVGLNTAMARRILAR